MYLQMYQRFSKCTFTIYAPHIHEHHTHIHSLRHATLISASTYIYTPPLHCTFTQHAVRECACRSTQRIHRFTRGFFAHVCSYTCIYLFSSVCVAISSVYMICRCDECSIDTLFCAQTIQTTYVINTPFR